MAEMDEPGTRSECDIPIGRVRMFALGLAAFVMLLGFLAPTPFLPVIAQDLGTTVAAVGQTAGLTMLLATIIGLISGPIADRVGVRRPMLLGLASLGFSALGTALAPSYSVLLLAESHWIDRQGDCAAGSSCTRRCSVRWRYPEARDQWSRRGAGSGIGDWHSDSYSHRSGGRLAGSLFRARGHQRPAGLLIWLTLKDEPISTASFAESTIVEYKRLFTYVRYSGRFWSRSGETRDCG